MIDSAPLLKVAGEPKELHETRLGAALPVLDMHLYVEEFGRSVVPAYRRGVADLELPADAGLARSIIPPGTAATRDFSRLAPTIPEFLLDKCVGCMACVARLPRHGDPRPGHPRARGRHRASRRSRRRMTIRLAPPRPAPPISRRPRSTVTCRPARASNVAHSASSSTPSTARVARNASRSAPHSAMTPWS